MRLDKYVCFTLMCFLLATIQNMDKHGPEYSSEYPQRDCTLENVY